MITLPGRTERGLSSGTVNAKAALEWIQACANLAKDVAEVVGNALK